LYHHHILHWLAHTTKEEEQVYIPSNTSLPFPFRFFLAFEDKMEEFGGGLGGLGSGGARLFNKERVSGQEEIILSAECIITRTDEHLRLRATELLVSSSWTTIDVVATGPSVFHLSVTKVNIKYNRITNIHVCQSSLICIVQSVVVDGIHD
jgi:hypothetical protein